MKNVALSALVIRPKGALLENLISFGSVKITKSTTTLYQNRHFECLSAVSCNASLKAITTFDNASLL